MRGVIGRSPQIKIVMEFNVASLQTASVDPLNFIGRIEELGLAPSTVSGGALRPVNRQELLAAPITTLFLTKVGATA
jgi:hypothetical protein